MLKNTWRIFHGYFCTLRRFNTKLITHCMKSINEKFIMYFSKWIFGITIISFIGFQNEQFYYYCVPWMIPIRWDYRMRIYSFSLCCTYVSNILILMYDIYIFFNPLETKWKVLFASFVSSLVPPIATVFLPLRTISDGIVS